MDINMSTAIFLVNANVIPVVVAYDRTINARGTEVPTGERTYKTLDASIKVGALVIIPTDTRWGFTIGKVTKIMDRADVDHTKSEEMRWLAQPIDLAMYDQLREQEAKMLAQVKAANDRARQDELAKQLRQFSPNFEGIALIDMAPISAGPAYDVPPPAGGGQVAPGGNGIENSHTAGDEALPVAEPDA